MEDAPKGENNVLYLKPCMRKLRLSASGGAVILFAIIVGMTIHGHINRATSFSELLYAKIGYCVWTILVPLWFFLEVVYGFQNEKPINATYKDEFDRVKAFQDAARPLWVACAAVMGLILFKSA